MARSTQQTRFRLANQILDVIRDARMEPEHGARPVGDEPPQDVEDLGRVRRPVPVGAGHARMRESGGEMVTGRRHPPSVSTSGQSVKPR